MNFFEHQEAARRQTGLLVFYFILTVIAIIAAIYFVAIMIFAVAGSDSLDPSFSYWHPDFLAGVAVGTFLIVGLGSLYKTAALASGGETIALSLGGRRIEPGAAGPTEKKLINIVQEMSIASGVPVPAVFVMDEEGSINAFAAGFGTSDAVIGVTRGAIDRLSRDELQGVIAHEFSHILNGDMRLNIRLIGVLHGILVISMIGYYLMRSTRYTGGSRREGAGAAAAMALFGLGLLAIGYIGVFFGKLIKAAVSRQREFLADAAAVQFTRNPEGIGGALKKIGGLDDGAGIAHPRAEEASHMFFGNGVGSSLFAFLATHPPIETRLERIYGVPFERTRTGNKTEAGADPHLAAAGFAAALDTVGTVPEESIARARLEIDRLPVKIREAIDDPLGAVAVVTSMLLDESDAGREAQIEWLRVHFDPAAAAEIQRMAAARGSVSPEMRLSIMDLALPSLRRLTKAQFGLFKHAIQKLIAFDEKLTLFEYMLQHSLIRHLELAFAPKKTASSAVRSLAEVKQELETAFSALAHMSHWDEAQVRLSFRAACERLGMKLELLPLEVCSFDRIDEAMNRLAATMPTAKREIVAALIASVTADRFATTEEAELLRAMADSLDCPIPLITHGVVT